MKIKRFVKLKSVLKLISTGMLWLLTFSLSNGLYFIGLYLAFTENWIKAIVVLLFAVVLEFKRLVDSKTKKRPKDILKRINAGRFDALTVRYGRQWKHDIIKERSAFQTGFDSGCDFILNMEDN